MRTKLPREFYIRKGSVKVADKASDAIAYFYDAGNGKPAVQVYFGKQNKPVLHCYFIKAAQREARVTALFSARRQALQTQRERTAARTAWVNTYKVGDIFRTNWGYEQTNVEFFECTDVRGKHVVLRELAQDRSVSGMGMQGSCVPLPGQYVGEPLRRLAQERGIKIDTCRTAWIVEGKTVAGIRVIEPSTWTAYH